jgi:hypothetical protein
MRGFEKFGGVCVCGGGVCLTARWKEETPSCSQCRQRGFGRALSSNEKAFGILQQQVLCGTWKFLAMAHGTAQQEQNHASCRRGW